MINKVQEIKSRVYEERASAYENATGGTVDFGMSLKNGLLNINVFGQDYETGASMLDEVLATKSEEFTKEEVVHHINTWFNKKKRRWHNGI